MNVECAPMGIKGRLRSLAGTVCRWSGATARAERNIIGKLVVPCYHRVLPAERKAGYFIPDLVVTPEAFQAHCAVLANYYETMPLSEAVAALEAGTARGKRLAAVTFDDGYEDNWEFAAPILERYGIRATFFVITDCVDNGVAPWYDRVASALAHVSRPDQFEWVKHVLCEHGGGLIAPEEISNNRSLARLVVQAAKALAPEKRRMFVLKLEDAFGSSPQARERDRFMTWEQVRKLADLGHEIGSHSHTHEMLTQLDEENLQLEVERSKQSLLRNIPQKRYSFCYPNGDVDDRVIRAVKSAGYSCAVSVEQGPCTRESDRFKLPRRFIHEERLRGSNAAASTSILRMELSGLSDAFSRNRQTQGAGRGGRRRAEAMS